MTDQYSSVVSRRKPMVMNASNQSNSCEVELGKTLWRFPKLALMAKKLNLAVANINGNIAKVVYHM